jgi:hypothetical protein
VLDALTTGDGPLPAAVVLARVHRPGVPLPVARANLSRTLRWLWLPDAPLEPAGALALRRSRGLNGRLRHLPISGTDLTGARACARQRATPAACVPEHSRTVGVASAAMKHGDVLFRR